MFSKFEYDGKLNPTFVEGPFELPLSSIRAYLKEPITPRFNHTTILAITYCPEKLSFTILWLLFHNLSGLCMWAQQG